MGEIRDALLRLIRAWTGTDRMLNAYVKAGLDDNMLFQAKGQIGEAICILIGEADADWETSKTYITLTAPYLTEERRLEMLMGVYEKNHYDCPDFEPKQPKPNVCTTAEIFKMFNENGGYLHETPEGGWS